MLDRLRKIYITMFLPWAVFFGLFIVLDLSGYNLTLIAHSGKILPVVLFVLAAFFSIAFPVFLRSRFAFKIKDRKEIQPDSLFNFEEQLIVAGMITPYLSLFSIVLNFPEIYTTGIFLLSLFSMYFYFPTERKLKAEMRIFGVKRK